MAKTWFQHDMNASAKDGLSNLLVQKNGCDLYGKFWLLQEHFYFSQMNSKKFKTSIRINESTMVRVLRTNRRRLGMVLETFRNTLGIVSEQFQEPFGTVYETTIPNALIYITKRVLKVADKSIELELDKKLDKDIDIEEVVSSTNLIPVKKIESETKYNPIDDCPFFNNSEFQSAWKTWNDVRRKKKCSFSDRAIKKCVKKIMRLSSGEKETAIQILDQSGIDGGWSDLYELKNKTKKKGEIEWL